MKYLIPIVLWCSVVAAMGTLFVVASTTSLFLYRDLVEFEGQQVALGNALPSDWRELSNLSETYLLPPDTSFALQFFSRYAIAKSNNGQAIAGLPRLTVQPVIRDRLRQSGWEVHRLLWLVVAERGTTPRDSSHYWPRAGRGIISLMASFFTQPQSTHPFMMLEVEAGAWPFIDQPYGALAYQEQQGIRVHIRPGNNFERGLVKDSIDVLPSFEGLEVEVSGVTLALAPEFLRDEWEKQLLETFQFANTTPAFMKTLSASNAMGIAERGEHAAIGVRTGAPEFTREVHRWIAEELSYQHLTRQAFRLPDGTVGYEYAPTAVSPVFTPSRSNPACATTKVNTELWLCSNDRQAVLATEAELGEHLLTALAQTSTWRVHIPAAYLQQFPLPNITRIAAEGDANEATVFLTYGKDE